MTCGRYDLAIELPSFRKAFKAILLRQRHFSMHSTPFHSSLPFLCMFYSGQDGSSKTERWYMMTQLESDPSRSHYDSLLNRVKLESIVPRIMFIEWHIGILIT